MEIFKMVTRLEKGSIVDGDHWLWTGSKKPSGHGQITFDGMVYPVNRLSAYIYLGLDLMGIEIACHKDDLCQHKNCWQPKHLYVGTRKDNAKDAAKAGLYGSHNRNKTHCSRGHLYSEENTIILRNGWRKCMICSVVREIIRPKRIKH